MQSTRVTRSQRDALEREADEITQRTGYDPRMHKEWHPEWKDQFYALDSPLASFTYPYPSLANPKDREVYRSLSPLGNDPQSDIAPTPTPEPTPEPVVEPPAAPVRTVKKPLRYRLRAARRENICRANRNADTSITTRRATYN